MLLSCTNDSKDEIKTLNSLKQPIIVVSYTCLNGLTDDWSTTVKDSTNTFYIFTSTEVSRAIIKCYNAGDTIGKPTKKME